MKIIIPGPPIAKKRPRFARIGKGVRTYSDQETEEGKFVLFARQQITQRFDGPLVMVCKFVMPRPKGHYGTGKNSGKLRPSAPVCHTTKPDTDNLIKFVWDCLNGEAWKDDTQIVGIEAKKFYADDGEPRTEIEIKEV